MGGGVDHITVNACLTPIASLHGAAVTTVEGIGSVKSKITSSEKFSGLSTCGFLEDDL